MGSVGRAGTGGIPDDGLLRSLVGDEPFLHERAHADVTVVDRKRAALDAAHVAPFLGWRERTVAEMRSAGVPGPDDQLPHVDPASGGVFARVVVLSLRRVLARSVLARWLGVLRGPERVVLLGATARQLRNTVEATLPGVTVRTAPSPGQMARITAPDFEEQIRSALVTGR